MRHFALIALIALAALFASGCAPTVVKDPAQLGLQSLDRPVPVVLDTYVTGGGKDGARTGRLIREAVIESLPEGYVITDNRKKAAARVILMTYYFGKDPESAQRWVREELGLKPTEAFDSTGAVIEGAGKLSVIAAAAKGMAGAATAVPMLGLAGWAGGKLIDAAASEARDRARKRREAASENYYSSTKVEISTKSTVYRVFSYTELPQTGGKEPAIKESADDAITVAMGLLTGVLDPQPVNVSALKTEAVQ